MAAVKGKLKEIFTKKRTSKEEDNDPITQLAKLGGVAEVKFPRGFAPGNGELLVPARFAALAQYIVDNAQEYTGVFRNAASKASVAKLREHFTSALVNAPRSSVGSGPALVEAKLPYDKGDYNIYEIADCFKLLTQDLPGGILGDVSVFESLRHALPKVQLKPEDPDLDFGCGGVKETLDTQAVSRALRDSSSKSRRNLILMIFGVLAVVRNDKAPTRHQEEAISLSRIPSKGSAKSGLSQELKEVSSKQRLLGLRKKPSQFLGKSRPNKRQQAPSGQNPDSPPKGTFVDPLEFRARIASALSSRSPTSPTHRRQNTSGSIYTDPNPPPPLPDLNLRAPADFMSHSLVPELGSSDPSGVGRVRSSSSGYSRYPQIPIASSPPEMAVPVSGTRSMPSAAEMASLTLSKSEMTSEVLGRIFAPLLLGNLTGEIKLFDESQELDKPSSGSTAPGAAEKVLAGEKKSGLRRLLRKRGEMGDLVTTMAPSQQLKITAWVVELLVRHWEAIVAEYGSGIEGVDAVVEGLWTFDE